MPVTRFNFLASLACFEMRLLKAYPKTKDVIIVMNNKIIFLIVSLNLKYKKLKVKGENNYDKSIYLK